MARDYSSVIKKNPLSWIFQWFPFLLTRNELDSTLKTTDLSQHSKIVELELINRFNCINEDNVRKHLFFNLTTKALITHKGSHALNNIRKIVLFIC